MIQSRDGAPALGRYAIGAEIASGGMATVHLGRALGPAGFVRTIAIKRLYPQYARDPEFVSMFLDEARLAARVQHPNVAATLDVVAQEGDLYLVMEYVRGESLSALLRASDDAAERPPLGVVLSIMSGVLHGLHAAHEATTERGELLHIIHRDVSPQNVLVGIDGVARLLDFGIAKAKVRLRSTRDDSLKGKLRYMAPEHLQRTPIDRRCDIYAASVVLWEMLTGGKLFSEAEPRALVDQVLTADIPTPRALRGEIPEVLDAIVMTGLARRRDDRFSSAREMAVAMEKVAPVATPREVGEWVARLAGPAIVSRDAKLVDLESGGGLVPTEVPGDTIISRVETIVGGHVAARPALLFDAPPPDEPLDAVRVEALRPMRRFRVLVGAGIALLAAAMTTYVFGMFDGPRPVSRQAMTAEPATGEQAAMASVAARVLDPAPAASPSSTAAPARTAWAPAAHARSAKPARSDCEPPYIVDDEGHKQYKVKCL